MEPEHPPRHSRRLRLVLALAACFLAAAVPSFARDAVQLQDVDYLLQREDYVRAFDLATLSLEKDFAEHGLRHPRTLASLQAVARTAKKTGELDLADKLFTILLDLNGEVLGPDDASLAECLAALGAINRRKGNYDEAFAAYERGLSILEPNRDANIALYAKLVDGQANVHRWQDREEAVRRFEVSLALRRQHLESPHFDIADNLTWLGWTQLHLGRHEAALANLDEAEAQLRALGLEDHSYIGTILSARADVHCIRGEWAAAEALYEQSTRLFELSRHKHLPGFSRAQMPLHGYNLLAMAQLKQGREVDAWRSLERYRNHLSTDFLNFSRWRHIDPETFARVAALRAGYLANQQTTPSQYTGSDDEIGALVRQLRTRAEIATAEQEFLSAHRVDVVELSTLRSALGPRTAYLGWLKADYANDLSASKGPVFAGTWVYVIRADGGIQWAQAWEADVPVDQYGYRSNTTSYRLMRERVETWDMRVVADEKLNRHARELGGLYVEPALPFLEGIETIVVEYSGAPSEVPLENMIDSDGRHFGDRFNVAYVASATAYVMLSRQQGKKKDAGAPTVLALGDPVFSPDGYPPLDRTQSGKIPPSVLRDALERDPEALNSLPRLPYSATEVQEIARMFDNTEQLIGDEASERALSRMSREGELKRYDIIHMATHALIDFHPERCAFALSRTSIDGAVSNDGLLDTREVLFGWDLDADVLTLSGCQTAWGSGFSRGEPVGFMQVFLAVGARSVVASMWKVDDHATALVMTRFYENLTGNFEGTRRGVTAAPMSKAASLAEAKKWLREYEGKDGSRPFEHPIYWSGFTLTGIPE